MAEWGLQKKVRKASLKASGTFNIAISLLLCLACQQDCKVGGEWVPDVGLYNHAVQRFKVLEVLEKKCPLRMQRHVNDLSNLTLRV